MATMVGMWTRERTTILIGLYEKHELLWNSKLSGYRNKDKRKDALDKIANEIKVELPGISAEDIKSKINGIRTQYVSELNRVGLAQMRNEDYEPSLWFFDKLSFLKSHTQPKMKQCSTKEDEFIKSMIPSTTPEWEPTATKKNSEYPRTRRRYTLPDIPLASSSRMPAISFPAEQPLSDTEELKQQIDQELLEHEFKEKEEIINQTIKNECSSDDEVYIIEDERYNIDQHGNRIILDQNGSRQETINKTPNMSAYENIERTRNRINAEREERQRLLNMLASSSSSRNSEITITPNNKRKHDEESSSREDKSRRNDNFGERSKEDDRLELFGQFIASQLKTITNKVLRVKLEHTIQNAIIETQLKQIDDEKKEKND